MKKTLILTIFLILLTATIVSAGMTTTINTANNTNATTKRPYLSVTPDSNITTPITCDLTFNGAVMYNDFSAIDNTASIVQITTQNDGSYRYNFTCTDGTYTATSSTNNINIGVYTYSAIDIAKIIIDTIGAIGVALLSLATIMTLGLVYVWAKDKF